MDWMHYRPVILATDALEAGACMYGVHKAMLSVIGCPLSMNVENYRNTTKFSMTYPRICTCCNDDNVVPPFGGNASGGMATSSSHRSFLLGDLYSGDGFGDDAFGDSDSFGEGDGYGNGLLGNAFTDGDGNGRGHYGDSWSDKDGSGSICDEDYDEE